MPPAVLAAAVALVLAQAAPSSSNPASTPSSKLSPVVPPLALIAPSLTPVRTPKAPVIDGKLDDPEWALAQSTTAFTQKFPVEGAPPSEPTTLRVLYDDDALYIAFDVQQKLVPVVGRMARRDRDIESDTVSIAIDSRALGKTAFEFTVNAAGVLRDGIRSNDVMDTGDRYSAGWDENWDASTTVRPDGWSAELRIPLRVLRFASSNVQTWGFQARRYTSMRQETDEWSLVPRNVASEVSLYGRLADLRVHPRSDLELRPFVLGRLVRRDPTDVTLDSGLKPSASAGLDVRWHLTPDFTLDATIHPDFTQVEGDELFLNLSNFESYFPEKRPFFVEGAEIFEEPAPFGFARPFTLLYTRRIGGRPDVPALRPTPPFDDHLVALPESSTILGATKLVGRLSPSWSVGAMSALTAPNTVEVQEPGGHRRDQLVEPTTAYEALRVKHDFEGGKAHLGFLGTAVVRAEKTTELPTYVLPDGSPPMTACPDGVEIVRAGSRCTHDAYVGSVDGVWRVSNGEILLSGQAIASVMKNGPPRILRDGTSIGDGDAGYGAQLVAIREGGSGLAWNAQYQFASRHLDYNDLGFMERQDQHFYYGYLEYRTFKPVGPTIETKTFAEVTGRYNLRGDLVNRRWLVDAGLTYKNFWQSYVEFNYDQKRYDDREIGNGLPLERPGRPGFVLSGGTDKRRRVFIEGGVDGQKTPVGGSIEAKIHGIIRVHPQLEIELIPSASTLAGEQRFAAFGATANDLLFGNLHASSVATTARVNFTITPRLALQTFGQVFLAAGHYDEFRAFTSRGGGPGSDTVRLASLVPTAPPTVNPDFEDVSLNVNVVLRWEYSLGSVLYLVGNRSQSPATALALADPAAISLPALGRSPAVDTLLLKWQLYVNL